MKCVPIGILLILISLQTKAQQYFQGSIHYLVSVAGAQPGYDVQKDYTELGKGATLFYKDGNYKWVTDDGQAAWQLLLPADSLCYLARKGSDTITAYHTQRPTEKLRGYSYKLEPFADTIMGQLCDVFTLRVVTGGRDQVRRYSIASVTRIDSSRFQGVNFGSFNFVYSHIKALPLRLVVDYGDRKVTYTARAIRKEVPDSTTFVLPKNAVVRFKTILP